MSLSLRARLALSFAAAAAATILGFSATVVLVIDLAEKEEARQHGLPPVDEDLGEDAHRVLLAMAIAGPVAVGGAAALGLWLASRALAPLREASVRARAARASSLDLTLPAHGGGAEWDALAGTLNALLSDGRAALTRIRRFTADAAHELRTPLTAIIGEAEVSLRRERTAPELRASLEIVREQAARLAGLVEALLLLARADAGTLLSQAQGFPLQDAVREAAEAALIAARAQGVAAPHIEVSGSAGDVRGNRQLVARALGNLLDNGLRYGGGAVQLQLSSAQGVACVRVEDAGPGIPESLRATLFEPFTRADPARTDGGLGLGLSLARAIAAAHGGTLTHVPCARGAAFELRLPC